MAVTEPLVGKFVNLRSVELIDAEFTLEIRNDPELTNFIPKVDGNIDTQKEWISNQRVKEDDYFFIIENKNSEPLGTLGCYDIDEKNAVCEIGRYISRGNSLENIEALVLLYDFIFASKKVNEIITNTDFRNKKVLKIHKRFGAIFNGNKKMNGWDSSQHILSKESYYSNRKNIVELLYFTQ